MKRMPIVVCGALAVLALGLARTPAEAGSKWSVGVQFGTPGYYRPWGPYPYPPHYHYYPHYHYRPVYVAPPPVVLQPAPVVVQPAQVVQPVYQTPTLTPAVSSYAPTQDVAQAEIERRLQLLADPSEQLRAESVRYLGRAKAYRAVDPLAATLAGDRSPVVREAAARALALIGSSKALPALQQAAAADGDREVRHSAQFAVDVIQTGR